MGTFLVIGATGGIGRAIVRSLLQSDNLVVGTGRHAKDAAALEKEFGDAHFSFALCDLETSAGVEQLAQTVGKKTFDWVVCAAGHIDTERDFLRQNPSEIEKTFAVNTLSVIHLTQLLFPRVTKGFIVISSTASLRGNKDYPVYSASKAAVNTFTQALARRYPERIYISLCPGPTNTPMRQATQGDAEKHQDPSVIADVVQSLLQKDSTYHSGDILSVRNGETEIVSRID